MGFYGVFWSVVFRGFEVRISLLPIFFFDCFASLFFGSRSLATVRLRYTGQGTSLGSIL